MSNTKINVIDIKKDKYKKVLTKIKYYNCKYKDYYASKYIKIKL